MGKMGNKLYLVSCPWSWRILDKEDGGSERSKSTHTIRPNSPHDHSLTVSWIDKKDAPGS